MSYLSYHDLIEEQMRQRELQRSERIAGVGGTSRPGVSRDRDRARGVPGWEAMAATVGAGRLVGTTVG
jgi:hypothetical protein